MAKLLSPFFPGIWKKNFRIFCKIWSHLNSLYFQDTNSIPAWLKSTTWTWPGKDLSPECTSLIGNVQLWLIILQFSCNIFCTKLILKLFLSYRQLGENYYTHLTTYIDQKSLTGIKPDIPGALTMRYVIKKMSWSRFLIAICFNFQWTLGLPSHPRSHLCEDCYQLQFLLFPLCCENFCRLNYVLQIHPFLLVLTQIFHALCLMNEQGEHAWIAKALHPCCISRTSSYYRCGHSTTCNIT